MGVTVKLVNLLIQSVTYQDDCSSVWKGWLLYSILYNLVLILESYYF